MTPKEYLQQAIDLEIQIDADMMEARRVRSIAEKITSTITANRVQGGNSGNRIQDYAIRLVEIENDIMEDVIKLGQVKRDIRRTISMLQSPGERTVLRLRYLVGMKWEEIAVESNYSYKWVHVLHGKALNNIKQYIEVHT